MQLYADCNTLTCTFYRMFLFLVLFDTIAVFFLGKTAFLTKDFSGKLIVKYRNGKNRSEIPYFLTVIHGGLNYDPMGTTYFINNKSMDMSSRVFEVKNEYDIPVHISHILFPEDVVRYFKVSGFSDHFNKRVKLIYREKTFLIHVFV